ncbi:MAG: tetratricopeptide repeat protein [Bacteroidales bacterium]|nr:tetratricopeptide repeat protein [Bacteroidales bacterium]
MKKHLSGIFLVLMIAFAGLQLGCSTKRNTLLSRTYHTITAHYNVYFNGNESYKKGVKKMTQQHKDDFTTLLPVFIYPGTEAANSVSSDMDRAIKKASKTIVLHSITAKPDYKKGVKSERQKAFYNKREYNKWIDDAYLLMAKAYIVKGELVYANNVLRQMLKDYPKENTYLEAQLLLARKLILEDEFTESGEILEKLTDQKKFPRKHIALLNATYAEYYIRRKMPDKAAEKLEIAAKNAPNKFYRLRYTFILGQLYQQMGNYAKATEKYNQVIRMNPPYEMTFNARINMANVFEKGKGNASEIRQRLYKLLADEKNTEYRDQIYYAIGNLYMAENNKNKAIENYKLSVASSTGNSKQKARSYLAIADIYYQDREYLPSQAYYDSALSLLDEKFPDFDQVNNRARSLTMLAKSLQRIAFEDSVQFVAKMGENERNMFIDQIIAKVKEKEAEELRRQQEIQQEQANNLMAYNEMQGRSLSTNTTAGGAWYFYNLTAKSSGEAEFKLKWGNRKLEDNWRRSNKNTLSTEGGETLADEEKTGEAGNKDTHKGLSNKTREYYLVDLPLTDSAMKVSHERILSNLFVSASIYKNDLREYSLAANQYQEIIRRYPDKPEAAEAYFQLYMLARQQNNMSRAEEYKSKLMVQFPESMYAKLLANPNFLNEMQEKERQASQLYEQAYRQFNQGNFSQALQLSQQGIEQYPNHSLKVKFIFLYTLSKGRLQGNDTLRIGLAAFIRNYPKTDEASLAKDIIAALDATHPESKAEAEKQLAKAIYRQPLENEKHWVFGCLRGTNINTANQLSFNLINYNLDHYPNINLNIKIETLGNRYQLVVVREFKTRTEAMNYLSAISGDPDVRREVGNIEDFFVINEENYKLLQGEGTIETYRAFYKEIYK